MEDPRDAFDILGRRGALHLERAGAIKLRQSQQHQQTELHVDTPTTGRAHDVGDEAEKACIQRRGRMALPGQDCSSSIRDITRSISGEIHILLLQRLAPVDVRASNVLRSPKQPDDHISAQSGRPLMKAEVRVMPPVHRRYEGRGSRKSGEERGQG